MTVPPAGGVSNASGLPVIGISAGLDTIDRGDWRALRSVVLPAMYAAAVTRAGAVAVVLPPPGQTAVDDLGGHAAAVVARLDGLVLAGGDDVDPARYAVTRHPLADDPQPDRDAWEIALTRAAIESDLPLLGICRGMQIMAIAAGGTLDQHLPDVVGTTVHSPTPGVFARHTVSVLAGTQLAKVLGPEQIEVPTHHHQGVATLPEQSGYAVSARHEDGTIEALEDPGARFRIGIQWHPEAGTDVRLMAALVASATRRNVPHCETSRP
ncbi:MAG: gamma-glutamyl-gamma-aminobutyrate hydrolase family protein [Actinomycetales bacterium]|nr:gamma-glutamyl-gamma-aminobutyrate hydrolase family protein [Actinomycetales bacterium]